MRGAGRCDIPADLKTGINTLDGNTSIPHLEGDWFAIKIGSHGVRNVAVTEVWINGVLLGKHPQDLVDTRVHVHRLQVHGCYGGERCGIGGAASGVYLHQDDEAYDSCQKGKTD